VDGSGRGLAEEAESTEGVTYFRNENQNGSLNEELSNKEELNRYQGCVEFRRPDVCSQEQEEGILLNMSPLSIHQIHPLCEFQSKSSTNPARGFRTS